MSMRSKISHLLDNLAVLEPCLVHQPADLDALPSRWHAHEFAGVGAFEADAREHAVAFAQHGMNVRVHVGEDPAVRVRCEAVELIGAMCDHLEMPRPRDERSQEIWLAVGVHVARQGTAIFAGARPALERLASNYALHTATGNPSPRVEAYFESMDARQLLGVPAGPDLVGIWKQSPEFYDRLFVLADATPERSVVVDDSADQLTLAASRGARSILVDAGAERDGGDFDAVIRVIDELPATVAVVSSR